MKSSKNLGQVANKMFRALEHLPDAKENTPGSGKQQAPSAGIARAAGPQLLQRPTVSIIAEDLSLIHICNPRIFYGKFCGRLSACDRR